ncbi:MAG: transporter substrate-binding domain-containing protein [Brevinematales bacterium]|nr:transporter substrate-binding domain-containing protein [Brevinematales bacterium]
MKILWKIFFLFFSGVIFAKTVVVGVYDNPPKIYFENGRAKGIFVEIIQEIAKKEKWDLTYYHSTWDDCIKKLEEEKIDILPDVAYSEERLKKLDLNKISVLPSWFQVYSREDITINNFDDLNNKKVLVLKNSIQEEFLDKFISKVSIKITLIKIDSYYEALDIIKNKKADAIVVSRFFAYSKYRKNLIATPLILDKTTLHYAVKKNKNEDLIIAIDKNLSIIINNPYSSYYRIVLKYLNEDEIIKIKRNLFVHFLFFAFLLIISLLGNLLFKYLLNIKTAEIRKKNEELERIIAELKNKDEELNKILIQKEKFLKELKHRTRNNMNIISSLIGIKMMKINNPIITDFAQDIKEKIGIMGLIHGLIEQTEDYSFLNIDKFINKYIRVCKSTYFENKSFKINLNLEPIFLNIDIAIPFCFVISEIIKENILKEESINIDLFQRSDEVLFIYYNNKLALEELAIIKEIIEKQIYGKIKIEDKLLQISIRNVL